jgi:hypothetical protein
MARFGVARIAQARDGSIRDHASGAVRQLR